MAKVMYPNPNFDKEAGRFADKTAALIYARLMTPLLENATRSGRPVPEERKKVLAELSYEAAMSLVAVRGDMLGKAQVRADKERMHEVGLSSSPVLPRPSQQS